MCPFLPSFLSITAFSSLIYLFSAAFPLHNSTYSASLPSYVSFSLVPRFTSQMIWFHIPNDIVWEVETGNKTAKFHPVQCVTNFAFLFPLLSSVYLIFHAGIYEFSPSLFWPIIIILVDNSNINIRCHSRSH